MKAKDLVRNFFPEILLCFLSSLMCALCVLLYFAWKYVEIPKPVDLHSKVDWIVKGISENTISFQAGGIFKTIQKPFELSVTQRNTPNTGIFYYGSIKPMVKAAKQYFVPSEELEFVIRKMPSGELRVVFESLTKGKP